MMEVMSRFGRHQLGAEELLELGRPIPVYRYAHTPYLAGRRDLGRVQVPIMGNLLRQERNLFEPNLGQAAPPAAPAKSSTLTKALIIGIPLAFVIGVFSLT